MRAIEKPRSLASEVEEYNWSIILNEKRQGVFDMLEICIKRDDEHIVRRGGNRCEVASDGVNEVLGSTGYKETDISSEALHSYVCVQLRLARQDWIYLAWKISGIEIQSFWALCRDPSETMKADKPLL